MRRQFPRRVGFYVPWLSLTMLGGLVATDLFFISWMANR